MRKKVLTITPHALDCPTLSAIVKRERTHCTQCGVKKQRAKDWDDQMQMVIEATWCPNGHGHSTSWRKPTAADMKALKLVRSDSGAPGKNQPTRKG